MTTIVTLLDIGGKPTLHINIDNITRIQDRIEPTDGVRVHLRGDSVMSGQDVAEIIYIINSGETPAYELDENGILVGYKDPRYAAQRAAEAAQAQAAKRAAQLAAAANDVTAVANAGFGADVPEEVDESDEELEKEAADKKVSFSELKAQKAAKTSFDKKAK